MEMSELLPVPPNVPEDLQFLLDEVHPFWKGEIGQSIINKLRASVYALLWMEEEHRIWHDEDWGHGSSVWYQECATKRDSAKRNAELCRERFRELTKGQ